MIFLVTMHNVSIIIPAYNEGRRLPACLDSILNLNYPRENLEVIVIDNGSTDGTREIAEESGAGVIVDKDKNVSGLRNLGARQAKGDIIAFVDADCIVSGDWLNRAAPYFEKTDVAAWGAPPTVPDKATWVQRSWYIVRRKNKEVQEVNWLESMNLFVRRDQFLAIGGFNEDLVTCEDADFSFRIAKYGKIISDSRIVVIHLGEASTVKEFMKKEIWRGQGNLKGVFSHGLQWKELPSLSIPLYFGLLIPFFLLAVIIIGNINLLGIFILLLLLPSVTVLFNVRDKLSGKDDVLNLFLLLQIYFFARTVAIFKRDR
ncbi:MAG: glycosyltransferase [Spirochaetota bacterium]